MKLAILVAASCLCLCAQQAVLSGVTVDGATQMPLAGVHVSLISLPDDAYGAISDAAGHYSIGNIRPGLYTLNAKHAGFVCTQPGVTLKAGEQNTGYRIVMTPEATIRGRVVDEFGDPVQGAGVRAVSTGDTPYAALTMRDETDDRGEYRMSGIPGKYFIEAAVHTLQTSGTPEIRTDGSPTTAYATTYYPGSLAKERAKVVDVAAGEELTGIDIHVAHRKSLKISGTVVGLPASGTARARVTIRVYHDNFVADDGISADADGSFVFTGLAPSEYRLQASADTLESPVVPVTVENDDGVVTLALTAGEELTGTLLFEGNAPGTPGETRTVRLAPADYGGTPATGGQVAADGSFAIRGIIPGVFRLTVDPLPENEYIKSLLVGGAEAIDGDLDFSRGVRGATVKVTVGRNGGQVSGSIADGEGRQVNGRRVFVVLAGDVNSFGTWRTLIASDSTFAIHGVRPGKYRLFAVDPAQFGGLRSYEPLKAIAARAEEIGIKEGDRIAKDLRLMGRDEAGGK